MTTEPAIQGGTTTFMWEYSREVLAQQLANMRALDAKMVQIFAAAGVAIGLAGFSRGIDAGNTAVDFALLGAVLAYLAVGACAWRHIQIRDLLATPEPARLWADHWHEAPDDIKHGLVLNAADIYEHNRPIIKDKARCVRWALNAAAVEFALIGIAIIAVRFP